MTDRITNGTWHRVLAMVCALGALVLLAAVVAASGCEGASGTTLVPSTSSTTVPAAGGSTTGAPAQQVKVVMKGFAFDPASVTVRVGDTVTWNNQDSATHNVVADDGSFKSQDFGKGGRFSFLFARQGTYAYSCTLHPNMKGKVVVQ